MKALLSILFATVLTCAACGSNANCCSTDSDTTMIDTTVVDTADTVAVDTMDTVAFDTIVK